MHQQKNGNIQIEKRNLSFSWYNTIMPIGHITLFNDATNTTIITRLCVMRKS